MNDKLDFQNSNIDLKRKFIYKIVIILLVIILFSVIAALSVLSENRNSSWVYDEYNSWVSLESNNEIYSISNIPSEVQSILTGKFPVYITGEIIKPGIYYVENSIYLFELVELSGGFTDIAAKEYINLVFEICDSMSIRIPSEKDISDINDTGITEDILIDRNINDDQNDNREKVNINTATRSLLESLPGIGPSTADAIIAHRDKFGNFKSIEDIMSVTGIKENKFNLIKDKITIS